MFSKELKARINEILSYDPAEMTVEEQASMFSEELVSQIRDAVESSIGTIPPDQLRNDLDSLFSSLIIALDTKAELKNERTRLISLRERLRSSKSNETAESVREVSVSFYTLIEANQSLRELYNDVTEREIQRILSGKHM